MHQYFRPWRAFASAAPATCDPYLPEPDTPLGGEKKPGGEDAVIRSHRAQRVTAARSWDLYKNVQVILRHPHALFGPFIKMMASRCTERAVEAFLAERGGRVQQMELIDHFLSAGGENDQSKAGLDREVVERVVDSVGFVEVENGVKFVRLNADGSAGAVMRADTDGRDHEECNGNIEETQHNNRVNGNPETRDQTGEREAICV